MLSGKYVIGIKRIAFSKKMKWEVRDVVFRQSEVVVRRRFNARCEGSTCEKREGACESSAGS
jgi:hypothetical protein